MSNTTVLDEHYQYRGDGLGQMSAVTATLHTGCPGSTVGNGSYTDTYLYDQQGNPLELIRQQLGQTSRYWYQTDGQGDVVAVVDGQTGNVTVGMARHPYKMRRDWAWYHSHKTRATTPDGPRR